MSFEILSLLAIIGIGFYGTKIFCAPSFRESDEAKRMVVICLFLYLIFMFCAEHPEKVEAWLNTPIFG